MTASWVIRDKVTKQVVAETFNTTIVKYLNLEKYEAVPIEEYLPELNSWIKKNINKHLWEG